MRKALLQILICFVIAFVLVTVCNLKSEDIKKTVGSIIDRMSETVNVMMEEPMYGEPIDEEYKGGEVPVYAVGGGKVTAVGENEEIGRYIKIKHGDQAESLYGNLGEIHVIASANVKKGQIIGIYKKNDDKDFYYSFKEF